MFTPVGYTTYINVTVKRVVLITDVNIRPCYTPVLGTGVEVGVDPDF